jgi:hypothetical protein
MRNLFTLFLSIFLLDYRFLTGGIYCIIFTFSVTGQMARISSVIHFFVYWKNLVVLK